MNKLNEYKNFKIKIVAGRNEKLYKKLSDINYPNIEVYGYVDNLNELMDESLYIVTKPGGVTIFEAINKELPLIVLNSNIGQERGNVEFVKQNKIGFVIEDLDNLPFVLDYHINNPDIAAYLYKNIQRIKRSLNYSSLLIDMVINDVI